jgi:hypothetical protein
MRDSHGHCRSLTVTRTSPLTRPDARSSEATKSRRRQFDSPSSTKSAIYRGKWGDGRNDRSPSKTPVDLGEHCRIAANVVEVLLDSDVWAARPSEAVGRDFTQTEWDVYVPGDLPLTPACGEDT